MLLAVREIIADSIEAISRAHYYDANISVVGCDKNMPGALIAMARLDRPSIMIYGGTIKRGELNGEKLDIVSAFESYGAYLRGEATRDEMEAVVERAIPGPGACGGMYTANTMASSIETLGMALPYSSSIPAENPDKVKECHAAGAAIRVALEKNLTPRSIMTKRAFENAFTLVIALGGSTNAVLHLAAMARAAEVDFGLDDFKRISADTPFLANLRPSGTYAMEDLHAVGGTPAVIKLLIKEGYIDGSCMTITGKTLAENVEPLPGLMEGQKVVMPISTPIKPTGHIRILKGNLAPDGAVAKITGKEGLRFSGRQSV